MKQQCHISFVYGSWMILVGGLLFHLYRADYVQAFLWVVFIAAAMALYVRYFPSLARYMGYGSVEDNQPREVRKSEAKVLLFTGSGCPFCPIVKRRLNELQQRMGFQLDEIDVTFRPDLLIKKGIRALPVVEVGGTDWIGNATSEQLAAFIAEHS